MATFTHQHQTTKNRKEATKQCLRNHQWPLGLHEAFLENLETIPIRYFICDDSASMNERDGHLFNGTEIVSCTRWEELVDGLKFHAELAHEAKAKTQFRFLNRGSPIIIGDESVNEQTNLEQLEAFKRQCKKRAEGRTPLCRHLREVTEEIQKMEPDLRRKGQKACVIIATDGTASDRNDTMKDAVDAMVDLPAWMVIRLCTDEEEVVAHWDSLESDVELKLDVIDDLEGEAAQVHEHLNTWINYGLPLHRIREFGVDYPVFDLIDEKKLDPDEIADFCHLLLGGERAVWDPPKNVENFMRTVKLINEINGNPMVFDPVAKEMKPWIDFEKLKKLLNTYKRNGL